MTPAFWKVSDNTREYFLTIKPCQNINDLSNSVRQYPDKKRSLSVKMFSRIMANGDSIPRDWLIYSPSTGRVFCYVCKLYSHQINNLTCGGFHDWKNGYTRIAEHENSCEHRKAMLSMVARANEKGRVDSQLLVQFNQQRQYWRELLKRVVEVVRFLCERALPFRGENETFGSARNGNFLGILELMSKFDPFLADHIASFGNRGRGFTSYLSSTTYEEFIRLMAKKVLSKITDEIKAAKYYVVSVDSTPDLAHVDQLALIIRYALYQDYDHGVIQERFIQFIPIGNHGSEYLADIVIAELENLGISIEFCRGQTYDNAPNMAGCHTGLQARILFLNPKAEWVPCAGHSLNLVGTSAVATSVEAVTYFGILQSVYNFVSASTKRWATLHTICKANTPVVKNPSQTRWSAHSDASHAFVENDRDIREYLMSLSKDQNEPLSAVHEAKSLGTSMNCLEVAFMAIVWNDILQRFHKTSE